VTFEQFTTAAIVAGVALAIVWLPRLWYWRRWARAAESATTFLMHPAGQRPEDLDKAATAVSATLDALGSRRGCGITIHRYLDGQTVRTAMTVHGHRDPDDVARSLGAAVGARPERADDDWSPPSPGNVWYARRSDFINRDPNDKEHPPLGEAAEWLQSVLTTGDEGTSACLSIGLEPVSRWDARVLRRWYNIRSGRQNETEGTGPGRASRAMITCWSDDVTLAGQAVAGLPGHLHRWPFTVSARLVTSLRSWGATCLALLSALGVWFVAAAVGAVLGRLSSLFSGLGSGLGSDGDGVGGTTGGEVDGVEPEAAAEVAEVTAESVLFSPVEWLTSPWSLLLLGAALVCGVAALVAWKTPLPIVNRAQANYRRMHRLGVVPVERTPIWSLVRMTKQAVGWLNPLDLQAKHEGQQKSANYPYRVRTLVLNNQHVAETLAYPPMYETAQQISDIATVPAPPQFTDQVAPLTRDVASLFGHDPNGRPVKILDHDRKHGVFIVGDPGSGKSFTCLNLWKEDAASRIHAPKRRGGRMTMLWIETKGDGADQADRALRSVGYREQDRVRFDLAADTGWRLELLDRTRPEMTAARLVAAFTYAFETGSVGPRAAEAMRAAFTIAPSIDPTIAEAADMPKAWPNVLYVAIVMMGADDRDGSPRQKLLNAFKHAAVDEYRRVNGRAPTDALDADALAMRAEESAVDDELRLNTEDGNATTGSPLYDAWRAWSYYEAMPKRQRGEILDSPRNKLTAVAQLHSLWTPDASRKDFTLGQLLEYHGVGILNFGSSLHGAVDEMTSSRLAAITLYLLWEEVKATCAGWLDQGRSVGIYADELTNLSGTGSGNDVIEQMRDKGRSSGVQLTLATQRFTQLPQRTMESTMGFGARCYMTTESIQQNTAAAMDLNGGPEGIITPRDIRELPSGWCAVRMRFRDGGLPPFTLKVANVFAPFDPADNNAATVKPEHGGSDRGNGGASPVQDRGARTVPVATGFDDERRNVVGDDDGIY
jgi:hypothetical protein